MCAFREGNKTGRAAFLSGSQKRAQALIVWADKYTVVIFVHVWFSLSQTVTKEDLKTYPRQRSDEHASLSVKISI